MIDFEYKENIQIEKEELIELFKSVNWKTAEYPNRLYKAIENSSYVISAWNNNKLIGLLSAIDDGNINVFLTYLLIKPQYQKLGIGKKMMSDFCNHYKGFGRRILTTELDKEDYYKKFGFSIEGIAMFNKDWGMILMDRIIITGASDGLARQLALKCVENNIKVVALCRRKPDYECDFIKTDLSKETSIKESCDEIRNRFKKFDALINCAGVISLQKVDEITYDELNNLIAVNSVAPIFLTSQLMNLIKENHADIINVGSTCGTKSGYEEQLAYTTSKWAIRRTSYNLQVELKKYNSRVIQLNVGGMNTKFHTKYNGKEIEHPEEWMNPKDIADIMLYTLNLPKNIEVSEITINRKNLQ